jgi:hypothetical protein
VETRIGQQEETSQGGSLDRRDSSAQRVVDIEPKDKPSRDFRITSTHRIGQGGLHEKASDNIAAIHLLKTLEAENREATDDEKPLLARFVGWGGMPNIFGIYPPQEWKNAAAEIKELLSATEFESARASTPNAHFTSPMVIEAVWGGLERLGLGKNAQVLEPAMGVGHFLGLMPESMRGAHRPSGRARGRYRLCHRYTDLEHHGRDVHADALSRARTAKGGGRRAFRRVGSQFRRSRYVARTGPGWLRLPHAHTLREIRESAGIALDLPIIRGCADGGYAPPAPSLHS